MNPSTNTLNMHMLYNIRVLYRAFRFYVHLGRQVLEYVFCSRLGVRTGSFNFSSDRILMSCCRKKKKSALRETIIARFYHNKEDIIPINDTYHSTPGSLLSLIQFIVM